MKLKGSRKLGQTNDLTFSWVTAINPDLEQWRVLAEEWLEIIKSNKHTALFTIGKFLNNYIHQEKMSTIPAEFLRRDYPAKPFYETCLSNIKTMHVTKELKFAHKFIDWVLDSYFSVEDDNGIRIIPSEYHNPISLDLPDNIVLRGNADESNKNALPYRYIKQLRTILVPKEATHFQDCKWALVALKEDWFVVEYSKIDINDPDCVWRERKATKREQTKKGLPEIVYELWSPVRAVALYIKLLLPLRTYQVRMLDSGEADTFRYDQSNRQEAGQWSINHGLLKVGSEKHPLRRGVFRKFIDPVTKIELAGLYINTNKTADIGKDEWAKGYEVPWQYEEVLYWLAKLRNWQGTYNPIDKSTLWTDLDTRHLGKVKDKSVLKQMGLTCFLFRDASSEKGENMTKPIRNEGLVPLWYKLLLELQKQCETLKDAQEAHSLRFVKSYPNTDYPLHSLRVSLITAYALEGGVPMPILSKCIAGHARLIMTLYYTKAGITYVSDKMAEAEQRMAEQEQISYMRWLKDATNKQLEAHIAINDPVSLQAVLNAQQSSASFIKDDKGICPKGALGCDTGGVYVNDDTGKTTYGVVPGYPEQNCVRCRWFLTGPAFLFGLSHHFNVLGYNIGETAERLIRFEQEVEELENLRFECEQNDSPFLKSETLSKFEKLLQQEIQRNDKLANDYNATLRLIDRCIKISEQTSQEDGLQFAAVGTMEDVKVAIEEVPNKLYQIQTVCNGATIFPETDVSKAVLQRSQVLDLTLEMNGQQPIFFKLTPEQQLIAGNAWMQLLINHTGSLKGAVPYAEGRQKLAEIGFEIQTTELTQQMTGKSLQLPSTKYPKTFKLLGVSNDKEVANVR